MKLLIFGPPGSGKGTLADIFSRKYNIKHVSTGDIIREHIKNKDELGSRMINSKVSDLTPDMIVNDIVKDRFSQKDLDNGFILDGYPRTINQGKFLKNLIKINGVIFVDLEDKKIINRISHRRICSNCGKIYNLNFNKPKKEGVCDFCGGKLFQRKDDTPKIIKERLKIYKEKTHPLMELFETFQWPILHIKGDYNINTEIDSVLKKIISWVNHENSS